MPAATVWWARTDWFSVGTTGISYDWPSGTLGGRVVGEMDQSGSFVLTGSYWMPISNYPAGGCRFRSTPAANLSGDAYVSTLMRAMFLFWETDAPRASCQLRATQDIFVGPSLVASGTLLHDIASVTGDMMSFTGHLPVQPFPTLDFDLDRTQALGIQLNSASRTRSSTPTRRGGGIPPSARSSFHSGTSSRSPSLSVCSLKRGGRGLDKGWAGRNSRAHQDLFGEGRSCSHMTGFADLD